MGSVLPAPSGFIPEGREVEKSERPPTGPCLQLAQLRSVTLLHIMDFNSQAVGFWYYYSVGKKNLHVRTCAMQPELARRAQSQTVSFMVAHETLIHPGTG